MSPVDCISLFAKVSPAEIAAKDLLHNRSWSYEQLDQAIDRLAHYLLKLGCKAEDRVVVIARNCMEQVIFHFACSRAQLIFAPINWRLSSEEIATLIELAEPKVLLVDPAAQNLVENRFEFSLLSNMVAASAELEPVKLNPENINRPSLLLFTSGTTSLPKGVLLTEKNLMMSGVNFAMLTDVDKSSCFLCEAPMFHVIGMVANIRPVLQQGGCIAISDGFKAERTLQWLSDDSLGISHYIGVPQMIESFRQQDGFNAKSLQRLTALITGGAPHKQSDILAWIEEGVSVVGGFGMSEAGTIFGMPVNKDAIARKAGSVGITVPWLELRVVDENGNDCPANAAGELWIRGDNVMPHYFRNPEATRQVKTSDNWFKTGDIMRCDEEGYFWAVDRKKDMFISGGENIYPAEIEAALVDYDGIKEAAVIGIPDEKWGEVGCLIGVPSDQESFSEEPLLNYLEGKIARYKIPKKIITVDKLPRTSTGKLQKQKLKTMVNP